MRHVLLAASAAAALTISGAAFAQSTGGGGAAAGAATGAVGGAIVGGPVGAVVGGVVGGLAGGLTEQQQPQFRQYVVQRDIPSYRYQDEVTVGTVLPSQGVRYYEVPEQYGVRDYRYTVVNDRVVLVDPNTRRVVQVIR
jgi:surface antigen